jgi:hypothetical protein
METNACDLRAARAEVSVEGRVERRGEVGGEIGEVLDD